MQKPHISSILNHGSILKTKIDASDQVQINGLIEKTRKEQELVIKGKEVDPELLKKVVTL